MDAEEIDAIVKDEEERWIRTYAAIEKAVDQAEKHFKADRAYARQMTSELVAAKRIEDKMQLLNEERVSHGLSTLRKHKVISLDSLLEQPYFARMVCNENGRRFEFLLGTASFPEARIVDWRESPLAAIYYHTQEGDSYCEDVNQQTREGIVEVRRSYRGKGPVLYAIELPTVVLSRGDNGWIATEKRQANAPVHVSGDGTEFRRAAADTAFFSRAPGQSGYLPPILSLLTPEQYTLITSPTDRPMIIQGAAGSGKTTVALHRLAWLLHEKNSPAIAGRCLVLVPTLSLQSYIKFTLPELGIDGVRIETFAEWANKLLKPLIGARAYVETSPYAEIMRFKTLPETLALLPLFIARQRERMTKALEKEISRWDRASKQFWENELLAPLATGVPILHCFTEAIAKAKQTQVPEPCIAILTNTLRRLSHFGGDLHLLWQDEDLLERVRQAHFHDPKSWRKIRDQLQLELQSHRFDAADDALLLHLVHLKWGFLPGSGNKEECLDYLIIDEAQDFSVAELSALLLPLCLPHHLMLVGDMAQRISPNNSFCSWKDMLAQLGFAATAPIELTVAHRSTLPIMELAVAVRCKQADEASQYSGGRMGPVPTVTACETKRDMVLAIGDWIRARAQENPHVLCGIICRFDEQATELVRDLHALGHGHVRLGQRDQFDFSPGVLVTSVHDVKGLEFRNVLIANASERAYAPAHPESRNLLYVAITRAEAQLDFIGTDPPTSLLPAWLFESDEELKLL